MHIIFILLLVLGGAVPRLDMLQGLRRGKHFIS